MLSRRRKAGKPWEVFLIHVFRDVVTDESRGQAGISFVAARVYMLKADDSSELIQVR